MAYQVLSKVGGLAANKDVLMLQDLIFAQLAILRQGAKWESDLTAVSPHDMQCQWQELINCHIVLLCGIHKLLAVLTEHCTS